MSLPERVRDVLGYLHLNLNSDVLRGREPSPVRFGSRFIGDVAFFFTGCEGARNTAHC